MGVVGDGNLGVLVVVVSMVVVIFVFVFVVEWGDKFFFFIIVFVVVLLLFGVVMGVIVGYGVVIIFVVLGGRFLSEYVFEKLIVYVGGVLFLVFVVIILVDIFKV